MQSNCLIGRLKVPTFEALLKEREAARQKSKVRNQYVAAARAIIADALRLVEDGVDLDNREECCRALGGKDSGWHLDNVIGNAGSDHLQPRAIQSIRSVATLG